MHILSMHILTRNNNVRFTYIFIYIYVFVAIIDGTS